MLKNTASQKMVCFAFGGPGHASEGSPITGDAANITSNVRKDGAGAVASNDVNPTETSDGFYQFDMTQAETNADMVQLLPVSATALVEVIAVPGITYPADATSIVVDAMWDEVLSGAAHNDANSAGRRIRTLQESGSVYGGAVWVDTVDGAAGTTAYENGTTDNPVDLWASAITLAALIGGGLHDFHIINGSSITLAESNVNHSLFGDHWSLALGGQVCSGLHVEGATVTGICTGTTEIEFRRCDIGTASVQQAKFDDCGFYGTVTMTTTDDYEYHHCYEKGNVVPIFTKTAGQTISAEWLDWLGDITCSGIESTDTYHIAGAHMGNIVLNGADGTVIIEGQYDTITDNRTGSPVLTLSGAMKGSDLASAKVVTDNLALSAATIIPGAAEAGTLSVTQMTTDFTEATDDHYVGRAIIWTSGVLANQGSNITAYLGSTGMFTYEAVTEVPTAADTFIVI